MTKKRTLSFVFSLLSLAVFAQESALVETQPAPIVKLSFLDSIKTTFIRNSELACVDSLWMKELANADLFEAMQDDIKNINPDVEVSYNLSTEVLKERLAKLDAKSPFNIEYSKGLENIIKSYLKNRPRSYERLMAISEYYFPMFEEHLAKYNIPLELKYLAIVESALNPRAKSHVGATGLWQFMYATGKQYSLNVNSYVDERSDPIKATEAACQYLSSLYNIFGDWDLVLASYNAGPGNVTKAIRRSNGYKNYWNIRKNLPQETQGYVPAFLATMYIYEYRKEHGITPKKAPLTYFETDTIMVKRQMSFKQIAQLLDMPVQQLQFLNPIYKLDVIPYEADKAHYLRLPKDKVALFTSNENGVYAYIDHIDSKRERPTWTRDRDTVIRQANTAVATRTTYKKKSTIQYKSYTVKRGDNLGEISNKYGVSVAELKKWNKIKGNNIMPGQKLKIQKAVQVSVPEREAIAAAPAKEVKETTPAAVPVTETHEEIAANTEEAVTADTKTAVAVKEPRQRAKDINYEQERMYIVQKGDSLFSIAKKHPGVTVENLKNWNQMKDESIQPGMKLKVVTSSTN
ncbi:LysM peptidoglycan-binding domain-containing protein [Flavobacterium sp. J372]|uniref:lytic transglycosylase domain-containing protein n=1 Tax=Flavobacterium sp. J372 TaxID=2898436 RepID=UPI0021516B75|nr:lytic transglycosylase domain-containing protein [Flavobacterium sp. J372]MCR5861131.1 LysM peptidoglycan-binding domain-containing protein [Flavobacterium sp. J372]